jgi:hypothetical protein
MKRKLVLTVVIALLLIISYRNVAGWQRSYGSHARINWQSTG